MSRETGRETDSSSSGAQGRGGAAYPSGTPPYGLRGDQEAAPENGAAAGPPEEPKTETTLTTRIRINIPGSRPIPPVVVRKPVGDADRAAGAAETPAEEQRAAEPPLPTRPAPARQAPAPAPAPVREPEAAAPAEPGAGGAGEERPTSSWFAPRKPSAAKAPEPPAPQQPAAPAPQAPAPSAPAPAAPGFAGSAGDGVPSVGSTTQSMPVVTPLTGGPAPTPAGGTPRYDGPVPGDPYYGNGNPLYDNGPGHTPAGGTPVVDAAAPPAGPTTGPVTGSSPVAGPDQRRGAAPRRPMAPRMSDDTAILTPQPPAPVPPGGPGLGESGYGEPGHVSGSTLTSGMPVVPPAGPDLTPRIPERAEPAAAAPRSAAKPAPKPAPAPAKKGRSKLVLVGVGVVGLAGVAYGAGLLLNHSDVPKGTTVLGVDIGGGTKEEAVAKLDAALGKRAHAPLQLNIGGAKAELAPDKAGLALDAQETVRAAAGSDYNPVSVIGSLFGGTREAKPVFPVDDEKLAVALTDLAGTSGSVTEGTIVFAPNKVTAVEGKAGKGLDIQRSMISVKDAYRSQVETGRPNTVELPVVTRQPSVTKDELDRAMEEFAQPAMSDKITINAGTKHIDFGPARSLPKILSMKAVDGRLVEVYNKQAITELLDGVFDGIMITKADGTKHQVNADDVAFVMRDALRGKTKAERTKTIDLSGEG
ncbi:hypothetical protein [Streptomyces sp. SKN60]|uniref:hypothetical protein n=1 Tax=Streptomyces sp. SKN60 TaxID=2855506 RepID=UPI002245ED80|nr:hypothetical protein [Streptomyces sp. SKN60]